MYSRADLTVQMMVDKEWMDVSEEWNVSMGVKKFASSSSSPSPSSSSSSFSSFQCV